MHTEHLHRTLSPQAYARMQDHLRQQAESEHRVAVQAFFHAFVQVWPRQLWQFALRTRQAVTHTHTHALEA